MTQNLASGTIGSEFGAFLDAVPDAMIIVGGDGKVLGANSHALALFGYQPSELIGQPVEILEPERFRDGHAAHRERYAGDPHTRPMGGEIDLSGLRKDRTEFPVEISLSPLETAFG